MPSVLKPPAPLPSTRPLLFLAGSIDMGTAEDWQSRLATAFADDSDLTLLNPRRDAWDASWTQSIQNPVFREQVQWELEGLERADVIALYLAPDTKAPISLLELGLHARSGRVVVLCPPGYWRRGNVEVVCDRYGLALHDDWDPWVAALRQRIRLARG